MFIGLCAESFSYTPLLGNEEREIIFSPLTLGDLVDFVIYYKFRSYRELKSIIDDFPPAERSRLLKEEYAECTKKQAEVWFTRPKPLKKGEDGLPLAGEDLNAVVFEKKFVDFSFECPEILEYTKTAEGIIYQLFLSARNKTPSIKVDDIRKLLPEDKRNIELRLYEMHGISISDNDMDNEDINLKKTA